MAKGNWNGMSFCDINFREMTPSEKMQYMRDYETSGCWVTAIVDGKKYIKWSKNGRG